MRIGLHLEGDTDAELHQWEGCHQLCSPQRAGTYMRVGATRYRWEFRLRDGEIATDYQNIDDIAPLIKPWLCDTPVPPTASPPGCTDRRW